MKTVFSCNFSDDASLVMHLMADEWGWWLVSSFSYFLLCKSLHFEFVYQSQWFKSYKRPFPSLVLIITLSVFFFALFTHVANSLVGGLFNLCLYNLDFGFLLWISSLYYEIIVTSLTLLLLMISVLILYFKCIACMNLLWYWFVTVFEILMDA